MSFAGRDIGVQTCSSVLLLYVLLLIYITSDTNLFSFKSRVLTSIAASLVVKKTVHEANQTTGTCLVQGQGHMRISRDPAAAPYHVPCSFSRHKVTSYLPPRMKTSIDSLAESESQKVPVIAITTAAIH